MVTQISTHALAIIKMFHARRSPEAPQKGQIQESAKVVAKILLGHLQTPQFGKSLLSASFIFLLFSFFVDDTPSLYTYYSVIFGLYNLLFVDGTAILQCLSQLLTFSVRAFTHSHFAHCGD